MKRLLFNSVIICLLMSGFSGLIAQDGLRSIDAQDKQSPLRMWYQQDQGQVELFHQLRNNAAKLRSGGLVGIPITTPICALRAAEYSSGTHVPRQLKDQNAAVRANTDCAMVEVNYTFPPTIDPVKQQQFITAFEFAVGIWESTLTSPVPIKVQASLEPLGPGILGSAGPNSIWAGGPLPPGSWFVDALADQLFGADINPSGPDIVCRFSTSFGWYLGVDGQAPPGTYDFVTVVLHELGHGLDFIGSGFAVSSVGLGTYGFQGQTFLPIVYDNFVQDGAGTTLADIGPPGSVSAALEQYLTSDDLFVNAPSVVSALGGNGKIYAPAPFQSGSSFSHWDETTFPAGTPNSLMTPQLGFQEAIHDPGAITVGMFADHGWTLAQDCDAPPVVDLSESCDITGIEFDPNLPEPFCDLNGNFGPPGSHVICLRINGIDPLNQPLDESGYSVKIKGKTYPIIFRGYDYFDDELYFYICVGGVPSDGKKNLQVKVKIAPGCTYTAPQFYTAPTCESAGLQAEPVVASSALLSEDVIAFPNPTFGYLNIRSKNPVQGVVQVFDPLGNVVLQEDRKNQIQFRLDIGHLNPGFYFVKVQQNDSWVTQRIVVSPK